MPVDGSFELAADGPWRADRSGYLPDVAGLEACLQCGVCTAVCGLAGADGVFPRKHVILVRLGLADRAAVDPAIWECYGCEECSSWCPSGVKPGQIMEALRQRATERFAIPRSVAATLASPQLFWAPYAAAGALLAVVVAAAGSFTPGDGSLRYAGLLPDDVLIPVFGALTVIVVGAVLAGSARAWRAWFGWPIWSARPRLLGRAVAASTAESVAHRRFAECGEHRLRAWPHRAVLFGLLGLTALSGVVAVGVHAGLRYPLPVGSPAKVFGNLAAALLVAGAAYFLAMHVLAVSRGEHVQSFEWTLPANLLLAALTGIAAEAVRYGDMRSAAYPVYFSHLVFVVVLLGTLPYTKFAHAGYRVLAAAGPRYATLEAQDRDRRPVRPRRDPPRCSSDDAPETLLALGSAVLSGFADEVLVQAYEDLRDESVPRGERRYFPNVKRLHGTAFEREKDRREVKALVDRPDKSSVQAWYEDAVSQSCTWWVENHLVARHALTSCMACGMCTSVCPAAEHYPEYDPRLIVDTALSGDETRLVELLRSDVLWFCTQCGSCTGRCPRENDVMALVGSLRLLAQLKGYHLHSARGRQQYAARHLWGGNLWNRGVSLYFRDPVPEEWPDFGPRYASAFAEREEQWQRVGASPDMDGPFGGRKVDPHTLAELRACIRVGGALFLWNSIEEHGAAQAAELGLDLDEYLEKVSREG